MRAHVFVAGGSTTFDLAPLCVECGDVRVRPWHVEGATEDEIEADERRMGETDVLT